jgi:nitrate/nitrite-specific signal transduction histidine kinase
VQRRRHELRVTVADTGRGLAAGHDRPGGDGNQQLGLQIVRTLAAGELRGTIELAGRAGGGTEAVLVVPLRGGTAARP